MYDCPVTIMNNRRSSINHEQSRCSGQIWTGSPRHRRYTQEMPEWAARLRPARKKTLQILFRDCILNRRWPCMSWRVGGSRFLRYIRECSQTRWLGLDRSRVCRDRAVPRSRKDPYPRTKTLLHSTRALWIPLRLRTPVGTWNHTLLLIRKFMSTQVPCRHEVLCRHHLRTRIFNLHIRRSTVPEAINHFQKQLDRSSWWDMEQTVQPGRSILGRIGTGRQIRQTRLGITLQRGAFGEWSSEAIPLQNYFGVQISQFDIKRTEMIILQTLTKLLK